VLSPTPESFTHSESPPLTVNGALQTLGLCTAAGIDLYHATPAVTQGVGFSGLIQMSTAFSRLIRHIEMMRTFSNPDTQGPPLIRLLGYARGAKDPFLPGSSRIAGFDQAT
jgi:hypothetical protein